MDVALYTQFYVRFQNLAVEKKMEKQKAGERDQN